MRSEQIDGLASALEARYPGVRVLCAEILERFDGPHLGKARREGLQRVQSLRLLAPLEALQAHGLVTAAMLEYARRNDERRRKPQPPSADDFYLCEALDARSVPGSWELCLWTDSTPLERRSMRTLEAKRLLRAIARGA
jgi:hypothetical protein